MYVCMYMQNNEDGSALHESHMLLCMCVCVCLCACVYVCVYKYNIIYIQACNK